MESELTPIDASKLIEEKLTAASGKSVLVQRDSNCSDHASIKTIPPTFCGTNRSMSPSCRTYRRSSADWRCDRSMRRLSTDSISRPRRRWTWALIFRQEYKAAREMRSRHSQLNSKANGLVVEKDVECVWKNLN